MKRIRFASTGVLLLLLGITAPIYAQQQQDRDKQDKQQQQEQNKQQQPRAQQQQQDPNKQQPRAQQQQQGQNKQQPRAQQRQQNQNKQQRATRQQQVNRPSQQVQRVQQGEDRAVWQQHRARSWQAEHQTWQQRGGYNGYRIPENNFRGNFGQNHGFHIYRLPLMIAGGYLRFQYGGLWFSVVDPWPEYWSDTWYENDDVYIDYSGDGYYMYNRRYPRDRIAIRVSVN